MADKHPTYGFRTFKGSGSRLLRSEGDDWVNVQAKEGTSGWKDGLLFQRTYAYQKGGANGAQHLYRLEAIRLEGLETVATGYGKTSDEAWQFCYEQLKRKGVMPSSATE